MSFNASTSYAGQWLDLTNHRFGKLTVLRRDTSDLRKQRVWVCQCDCGKTVSVTTHRLIHEKTTSCGCDKVQRRVDLFGQRFGRLTVIGYVPGGKGKTPLWHCRCDCGNEIYTRSTSLQSGKSNSCGCYQAELASQMCRPFEGTSISKINSKLAKNNKTGVKGVFFSTRKQKYIAVIELRRVKHYLGMFDDINDAIRARKEAEERYFHPIVERYNRAQTSAQDQEGAVCDEQS